MNPRKQQTCSNPDWCVGSMTEHWNGKTIAQPFRVYPNLKNKYGGHGVHKHGDIYGMEFPNSDEAHKYMRERGYSHYYCRNITGFVMSRAARKRGYTTTDRLYLRREERGGRR